MQRKALVTGSAGFVGRHLVEYLNKRGWTTFELNLRDGLDLRVFELVRNELDIVRPDAIFHLAAQASPAESFRNPWRTFEVNVLGSINLLEAVRHLDLKCAIHLAGTSEEYGDAVPTEDGYINPRSPYAISKYAMDQLGQTYARGYGMHVVTTRAFNHTGPGRGEMYAESSFAKQIAEIERGKRKVLEHGNLETVRNFTDVRDVVKAYELAASLPSGAYNICSRQNIVMADLLTILKSLSSVEIPTREVEALKRPNDFSFKEPNCAKFQQLTPWTPKIPLEKTLTDLLNYWRERV